MGDVVTNLKTLENGTTVRDGTDKPRTAFGITDISMSSERTTFSFKAVNRQA